MKRRPKGFDPLASLFQDPGEDPSSEADSQDIAIDPSSPGPVASLIELTDPVFSPPTDGGAPTIPLGPSMAWASTEAPLEGGLTAPVSNPASPVGPPTLELLDAPREARGASDPDAEDALAPDPSFVEPLIGPEQSVTILEVEPETAAENPPATAASSHRPPSTGPDPVLLARALAKAAAARMPRKPAPTLPPASAPRIEAPRAVARPPSPPPPTPGAKPQQARRTPEEIVADALRREAEEKARRSAPMAPSPAPAIRTPTPAAAAPPPAKVTAPPPGPPPAAVLVGQVEALLSMRLKGMGGLRVASCLEIHDRTTLSALWKGHKARFTNEGCIEQVLASSAVLDALRKVPDGCLVVARALTPNDEYLVWMDLRDGTAIAAFPNARAWLANP